MSSSTNTDVGYAPVSTGRPSKSKKASNPFVMCFTVLITILLGATITLAILYSTERYNRNVNQTKAEIFADNGDVCLSRHCIKAASHLLENMDETADPCENFYEFTCGSWMKNTKLTSNDLQESPIRTLSADLNNAIIDLLSSSPPKAIVEPKAVTNARRLYNSCVDEFEIELENWAVMIRMIDEELGGLPSVSNSIWDESIFDLSNRLLKLNQYNYFPFYQVAATIDYNFADLPTYGIRISPGNRRNDPDGSLVDDNAFTKSYKYLTRDLALMSNNLRPTADTENTELSDFVTEIKEYLSASIAPHSTTELATTLKNLSKTINTDFDFSHYLRRLYLLEGVTLTDDDVVIISNIESIRKISSLVARQSPHTLQSYMIVRFIESQAFHMPKRIRHIFKDLKATTTSVASDEVPRSIACAEYVNKNMQYAVSKLYIDKYFDRIARQQSIEIVDNIRNTFIHMVNKSTWMDAVSKKNTIEKAQAILKKVGYPDYLDGDRMAKLESIYAKHNFNSSHIQNVLLLLQLNAKENLRRLRQPINREEWTKGSTTINAFYRPFFNDIIIPAGILQPPFFHKDAPQYLNYGAIGSVIGHEITHGFDELRRHIDKDAKEYTLWSNKTNEMYEKRSKCIVEQYNNYTVSQISRQVDGDQTRDENIADNDGLKKAFYAYRHWAQTRGTVEKKLPGLGNYSAEQMFFISFGQSWCSKTSDTVAFLLNLIDDHSPAEFRVNGPASNFVEFDRVFGCKPGQGNSRMNKCSVW